MSSFSALFGSSAAKVDANVDNLFKSNVGPVSRDDLPSRTVILIERPQEQHEEQSEEQSEDSSAEQDDDDEENESDSSNEESNDDKKDKSDMNEDLESNYFKKLLKTDDNENENDDENNESAPQKTEQPKEAKAAKTLDLKETELEKAERTVFVGNVPVAILKSKSLTKKFKKFFSEIGKIESVRFRSISFNEAVPRKVAFARKSLHESRSSVNAYVVYKEKETSLKAMKELNGKVFEKHHLRVDHLVHPSVKDNKRTIFVGNLDFEEHEENLWNYFNKINKDVESVRVIRDAKTNLGKGFALVQFKDTLSVNKALMLNDKPIKYDDDKTGRKLRISRASKYAKPSVLSPNHIDNSKKTSNKSKTNKITEQQKTKLGRAQAILGKADKASAGKFQVIEGQRASKGGKIAGIKGLKSAKGKVKKPRIRDRSTKFKTERNTMQKELKK
jgi:nucleolar protein 12